MKSKMLCQEKYCGHLMHSSGLCSMHYTRKWRIDHPLQSTFSINKANAKRRGKDWSLTIEQFRYFCQDSSYLLEKGKTRLSASIDRIENNLGYHIGNIRSITLSLNSSKADRQYYALAEKFGYRGMD